jgi:hypothetical protein
VTTNYIYQTAETPDVKPPKPTLQQLLTQWEWVRRYYTNLKYQQELNHSYYNLKVKISTPTGYDMVLPPTARNLVNDGADHIASAEPLFTVPRAKFTEKAERKTELINKWMKAFWERANETEPMPLHRTLTVHALSKGMLALSLRYVPERVPHKPPKNAGDEVQEDYENRRRMAFPFVVKAHDPRYIFPDPGTDGQTFVIEHFIRNVGAVQAQHPEWQGWKDKNGEPRDPNEPVEWIAYTDRYWKAWIADHEFVTYVTGARPGPVPHGLGFCPWVIRSAGLGDNQGLPDEKYQSMLYIVQGLLDEEMRAWSQGQAIIKDSAWPWQIVPIGVKVDPGSRKISEVPADMVDKIKQLRPDAQTPKAVLDWISQVEDMLERSTYSQVVTGKAPAGQRSGYSIAVLAGMARVKFGPILFNIESALAEMMRKALLLVENKIGEDVPIWLGGDTDFVIGPSDIAGYERVDCQIEAKLLQDRAADADIGLRLFQTGKLSAETLLKEYAHIQEPLEEIDRRLAEDFLNHPAIQAVMLLEIAKMRGIDPLLLNLYLQGTGLGQLFGQGGANGTAQPPGQTSPGGTPAGQPEGMAGGPTPGAPAPPGRPSVPGPGPTSPIPPGGPGALQQVAQLPRQISQANFASTVPLG